MSHKKFEFYTTSKEAWEHMEKAISKAQSSIYWESYIFLDDEVGKKFIALLLEKAKKGVEVVLLFDALASYWISKKRILEMQQAGIKIRLFRTHKPLRSLKDLYHYLRERTHRIIIVVDDTMGFVGGVNVSKEHEHWLDLMVKMEGKVCRHLSRTIAKNYIFSGGAKKDVSHILHPKLEKFKELSFIFQKPGGKKSKIRGAYLKALRDAKKHVILVTPYYTPEKGFLKEIKNAVKRGVKIDLLIPLRTDWKFLTYIARNYFTLTHQLGVKLHLITQMMHGKALVVDDKYAIIGSSNIDSTSFRYNHEANAQIYQKNAIKKIKGILEHWKKQYSIKFEFAKWKKRGLWRKIKEWFYSLFSGEV